MKERIRQIMEHAGLSQQDYASKLGISPASLSSIYNGRTNPTNNHVQAVHRAFPDVNINWLLFGEGGMFNEAGAMASGENEAAPGLFAEPAVEELETGDVEAAASLFGVGAVTPAAAEVRGRGQAVAGRRETVAARRGDTPVGIYAKEIDRPSRRIKEIRVFFDDGTYEAFVPSGK